MDPLSATVFASIGSAFKFADVAVRIAEVGSENAVFVRAICVVRSDLEEVERLLSMTPIRLKLTCLPGKLSWIMTAVQSTKFALNEIGKWVERARVEQETTGSIKFETRVRWVFSDHEKLLNRQTELSTCHQQLSNVLGYLTGLEDSPLNPPSQQCADPSFFDEVLARHRRLSKPQTSESKLEMLKNASNRSVPSPHGAQPEYAPSTFQPLHRNKWISAETIANNIYEHSGTHRDAALTPLLSPPSSPPPTYAATISINPIPCNVHSDSRMETTSGLKTAAAQSIDNKDVSCESMNSTWAHRSDLSSTCIPELVGDTVSFHATNSMGPINPYELYTQAENAASNKFSAAHRRNEDLAEMLGDLYFPAELPSKELGSPPGYPPRILAASEHAGAALATEKQARRRTTSDTPPRIPRRPLPKGAHSDSLLTSQELSSLPATHKAILPILDNSSLLVTTSSSVAAPSVAPPTDQRPATCTTLRQHSDAGAVVTIANRHYSAPPLVKPLCNERAAAYSADSTSSWGLNTEPKTLKARTEEPARITRMQSQMRIMDLLGRIDS